MTHKDITVVFHNGDREVGAVIVAENDDGTVDLFAPEQGTNDVKYFEGIPEGSGGLEFSRA